MRDKRSEGMKGLMARARRDLISRTARVWSKLARSIIKERGAEVEAWSSRLMANAEEATTKGTELDAPPFPGGWADALRDDLIYAMAQGFWLQHVYMQEARAARRVERWRVPEGDPTKAALEALTKRKMTLADSDDWHKVIPKDAIDWIEGYTPKLAGTLEKDVLERVRREVQGSLAKGTSVRERVKALREASPKVAAMSKARVEAIARTEVTRADTMGRLLSMKRDEDVIGVEFSAVLDSRTTPGCERRHGLVMRLDDPRLPENAPPRHVNCRSMLLPVLTWDAPDGLFTSHEFDDVDMPRGGQRPEDVEVVRGLLEVMSNIEPAPPVSELRLNPDIVPPAGIGEHQAAKRAEQRSISSFEALPEARTIKEANEIAIKYGIAKRSDFSGLDISVANTVIADVARTKRMFPEMETFDFVGTMKRHDRMAWKLDVAEEIEKLRHRYPKMSGRELYKQAKKAVPYPEFEV